MSNVLLTKPKFLDPSIIDCSVGEPQIVRDIFGEICDLQNLSLNLHASDWEYPHPNGYLPLVELLEDKYKSKVVMTNGAKMGLAANFYTLQQMKKKMLGMISPPHWALLPPLIKMYDLNYTTHNSPYDAMLLVNPNNPDGKFIDGYALEQNCRTQNIPMIHDAVYANYVYLPRTVPLTQYGDAQIFSVSKLYGLSSCRLGYITTNNEEFYHHIQNYMETMTVGVSVISQVFLYNVLTQLSDQDITYFENKSFQALQRSKQIAQQIDPEVLEVPANFDQTPGMFLFAKVGKRANFQRAKINPAYGEHFGAPGYVRLNIAFSSSKMTEIVERLNAK